MELPSFRPRRALTFFLPASALLFSFELASGSSFGLLELSVAGLSVSLLLSVWGQFGFRPVPIARFLSMAGTGGAPLCFAALFYLAADLLSVLYSPALRLMWEKYRVVAALLVVAAAVSFVRGDAQLLRRTEWALAWSAPLIALATLLNYYIIRVYPMFYTLRLSLRRDYNMYATALYTASVLGIFLSVTEWKTPLRRAAGVLFFASFSLPMIFLSGSRRIYILLPITIFVFLAVWAWRELSAEGLWKGTAVVASAMILAGVFSGALAASFQARMHSLYAAEGPAGVSGSILGGGAAETRPEERYETVSSGSMFTKRFAIWKIALNELKTYRSAELLAGRGGGYQIVLYDDVGEELDPYYPDRDARRGTLSAHNMMLADLLDGGILKLSAEFVLLAALLMTLAPFLFRNPPMGLAYGMILGLSVVGSMVSNRYGLLYDRYFIIFAALCAARAAQSGEEGTTAYENRHADHRSPAR